MKHIKLAAASLNQTALDWAENKANILVAIDNARAEEVSVLCLPELCISGYGAEDMFMSDAVLERSLAKLSEIAPATKDTGRVGGPLREHASNAHGNS